VEKERILSFHIYSLTTTSKHTPFNLFFHQRCALFPLKIVIFISSKEFCMKKWILRALILLFFLTFIGIGSTAAAVILHQKPQPGNQNQVDQEALNGSCGVERWSVKTGTDADAGLINLQSTTQTTIASLVSLPAPTTLPSNNRIQPTETTIFQVHATLTEYKLESDSDYHLILSDGSGNTMISEIASPACVGSSSVLLPGIQNARSEMDAHYTVTSSFQTANVPVIVTGVGFFDFFHSQTGVAPNGIELHPVLDVQFGTGGTPTPSPTSTLTPIPTNTPIPSPTSTLTPIPTNTPLPTPTGTLSFYSLSKHAKWAVRFEHRLL
jgi:hypothetical protein